MSAALNNAVAFDTALLERNSRFRTARARLPLRSDEDVVGLRRHVRERAVAIALSLVDQTKLVTAASELARNTIKYGGGGEVMLDAMEDGFKRGVGLIFLDGTITGKGVKYSQYDALCLETHAWVNAINVPTWKDTVILKPGQTYKQHMVHRFTTK